MITRHATWRLPLAKRSQSGIADRVRRMPGRGAPGRTEEGKEVRTRSAIVVAIALVAAGCMAGSTTTPTPTSPPVVPATASPAAPSAAPSPSEAPSAVPATPAPSLTAVSGRVTFDGKTCTYTGPTVIPFPASLTLEYAPSKAQENTAVGILAIKTGTTVAQLDDPRNPAIGEGDPSFAYVDTHLFQFGAATFEYRAAYTDVNPMADPDAMNGKPYDTYLVMCIPAIPGYPAGGWTILHVVVPGA